VEGSVLSTRERAGGEAAARSRSKAEAVPEPEVELPEEPGALNLKDLKDKKIADLAAIAKARRRCGSRS